MIDFQYIVLNGYANERKYFFEYLLREQKKAEEKHYQAEEFFQKCVDVVEGFKGDLDRQLHKRKHELYLMLDMTEDQTKKEDFRKELQELSIHDFAVHLHGYTNGSFRGNLWSYDVLEIEAKTLEAYKAQKLKHDEPQQEKDPLPDNPYPEIFTNDTGFAIFKRLHEKYQENNGNWQANYSFLFQALAKDKLVICKGREFIDFLSKHFQIEIDKIDSRQAGNNTKTTAYEAVRDLYTTKAH